MSAVVVTIVVPVPDASATQGDANRVADLIAERGFSEHARTARRRGCPAAASVLAEVVEARLPIPSERGSF